jgi:hypothetical protein
MLAIAFQYGVKLEDLLAANPDVDPTLLSVGTEIVIPRSEASPAVFATPTPMALDVQPADCYSDIQQGVWCFANVINNFPQSIENVSAQISLVDPAGRVLAEGDAIPPLNIIPAEQAIPLAIYFAGAIESKYSVTVQILSALPVPRNDGRYLEPSIDVGGVSYRLGAKSATVTGTVGLPLRSAPAGLVWLAAVAYDSENHVLGIRKIELNGSLEPGSAQPFEIELYSLGPPIDRVDVLVEARP